jgi:hypothetical protein
MKIKGKKLALILSIIIFFVILLIPSKGYSVKYGKAYFAGDGSFYCDCEENRKTCKCTEPGPIG